MGSIESCNLYSSDRIEDKQRVDSMSCDARFSRSTWKSLNFERIKSHMTTRNQHRVESSETSGDLRNLALVVGET